MSITPISKPVSASGALVRLARPSAAMLLAMTLLCGLVYPGIVTAFSQLFFPTAANGSLLLAGGEPVGSRLIGQRFTSAKYFWGRPSATTPPYNALASAGSNFSPANPALKDRIEARLKELRGDSASKKPVPADLVMASGSGLDPHISVEAAEYQVPRVAKARGLSEKQVRAIVQQVTEKTQMGFIGLDRVHVLRLNLALDQQK